MTHRERHESEGLFTLKAKPGPGFCLVKGCRKSSDPKKVGLCHCHHQYRWRMKSPKRSAFSTLRDHAKGRGIAFTISYDYFLGLTDALAWWDHAAESRGEALSIDRIDITKGYVFGNIRVLTVSENAAAGNRERFLPETVRAILARKRERAMGFKGRSEDDCPF